MATVQDINREIRERYGGIREARKATGIQSASQIKAMVARDLAQRESGRQQRNTLATADRYDKKADKKARFAQEEALERGSGVDVAVGSKGVKPLGQHTVIGGVRAQEEERYESVKDKVLSDLDASAKRIAEKEAVERKDFEQRFNLMMSDGTANPVTSSFYNLAERERIRSAPLTDVSKENMIVMTDVRTATSLGVTPNREFFEASRGGRRIITEYSDEFKGLIGSPAQQEVYIEQQTVNLKTLREEGFRGTMDIIRENRAIERANRQRPYYGGKPTFLQSATSLATGAPLMQSPDVVYYSDEVKGSSRAVWGNIGGSVAQGGRYLVTGQGLSVGFEKVGGRYYEDFELGRAPTAREGAGLFMIGYTATSVFTGKAGEVVDAGLAVPDFARAVVSPTPMNRAIAKVEMWDVATGVLPIPIGLNVKARVNVNTDAVVDEVLRSPPTKEFSFGGGDVGKGDAPFTDFNDRTGGFGGIYAMAAPLPLNQGFSFADLRLDNSTNLRGVADYNVTANAMLLSGSDVSASSVVSVASSANTNTSAQAAAAADASSDVFGMSNVSANTNVSTNTSASANANVNLSMNTNVNTNLNLDVRGDNRQSGVLSGSYQAFSKVQGILTKIGLPTSSKEQAFLTGYGFAESTAARTLGVTRSNGTIRGLDLGARGSLKKKRTRAGTVYVEPSLRAINTPGERAQISFKGQKARKRKNMRLRL